MEFKNYTLIVFDDISSVSSELTKIVEEMKFVNTDAYCVCTFMSNATINELKEYVTMLNVSFLLFEMGEDNYAARFQNKKFHKHLFGDAEKNRGKKTKDMQRKVEDAIKRQMENPPSEYRKLKRNVDLTEITSSEREKILNSILDKGYENLTEEDKKTLEKLKNLGE
jgi:hypothetical protein